MKITRLMLTGLLALGCNAQLDGADPMNDESIESTHALRGVDRAGAFTPNEARELKSKYGVAWTGVYIGGACSGGSGWTLSSVDAIERATGWKFMPIFVGQQSPHICGASDLSYAQGQADGRATADRMRAFEWHGHRAIPVALDVEAGTFEYSADRTTRYVEGWIAEVKAAGYVPYIYSSPSALNHFASLHLPIDGAWVASYFYSRFENVSPYQLDQLGHHYTTHDRAWQYAGDAPIPGVGGVDCNTSDLVLAPKPGGTNVSAPKPSANALHATSAVARNQDGRLEVFARGDKGQLLHKWQHAPGGSWSAWSDLGGDLLDTPAVVTDAEGRLSVFGRGAHDHLVHLRQQSPGGAWTGWQDLGGAITTVPTVVLNHAQHPAVFARGSDGHVHHISFDGASWSSWSSLGGDVRGSVTLVRQPDGRLEVFARGTDDAVWHREQETPGGTWTAWSSLGGSTGAQPAAALDVNGRTNLFIADANGALHHRAFDGSAWGAWSSLGGKIEGLPSVGMNKDGRLEVFARGDDDAVWHVWQHTAGGAWGSFGSLKGKITDAPTVAENRDGRLEVFVRGTNDDLYHGWESSSGWDCWTSLGGQLAN